MFTLISRWTRTLAIAGVVTGVGLLAYKHSHAEQKQPMKVRWLIAHEPADAFRRAAKTFAAELDRESHGQLQLEVLTPKDFGVQAGSVSPMDVMRYLAEGKVELSQTVTTGIGEIEPNFYVLDLPFLFRDHQHAAKVLEGKVGNELLASLERDKVHGLAFTYSGGFRVIPSTDRPINSVKDFKGMRVRTTTSPVAQATLRQLGATPVPISVEDSRVAADDGTVNAAETTYIRVTSVIGERSKYLNETYHSLFLTSILASDQFFKSLSPENREALKRAAIAAARIEREDSVSDGERVRGEFERHGVKVVRMSPENERAFREKIKPIYAKFEPIFGKTLVEEIRAVH